MSLANIESDNPVIRLVRQTLSFSIIIASIVLGAFLVVETQQVISPSSSFIRYNSKLVEIYLTTSDWRLIHSIEAKVQTYYLDDQSKNKLRDKIWNNYLTSPEEYRFLDRFGNNVSWALSDRDGEYTMILTGRSNYLRATPVPSVDQIYLAREHAQRRGSLDSLLSQTESDAKSALTYFDDEDKARKTLKEAMEKDKKSPQEIEDALYKRGLLVNFPEVRGLQQTVQSCSQLVTYQETTYQLLSPRYKLPVYDALQRVGKKTLLLDIANAILSDKSEDPYLRLVSADYLNRYGDPNSLTEKVYALLEDAKASGAFIKAPSVTPFQETVFEQELMDILRQAITRYSP